jgi:hypothetical protein
MQSLVQICNVSNRRSTKPVINKPSLSEISSSLAKENVARLILQRAWYEVLAGDSSAPAIRSRRARGVSACRIQNKRLLTRWKCTRCMVRRKLLAVVHCQVQGSCEHAALLDAWWRVALLLVMPD